MIDINREDTMPRWFDIKISQRILLGFSFAALLTLVVAAVSFFFLRGVGQRLTSIVEHDQLLLTSALELQVAVEQESDGIRGYLLSGDESFLEPFVIGQSHYAETATKLEGLIESEEDRRLLSDINTLHREFLLIAEWEITVHDQGLPQTAIFLWQRQGNEIKSDLCANLTSFVERQQGMISQDIQEAGTRQNQALAIALTLVVLAWAAGMAGAIWISRSITQPISRLVSATEAISRGDLTTRTSIPGSNELATLGSSMNQMVSDLEQSRETTERLIAETRRRAEQLREINEVGRRISSILSVDELLPYVVHSLKETFSYYYVLILLLDTDSGELVVKASNTYEGIVPAQYAHRVKVTEGMTGWVYRNGEPLLANDVSKEPRYLFNEERPDTRSELGVPIKIGTETLGVLDIESVDVDAFDEIDLFTAQTLADQLAIAIENTRLYRETRDMAVLEERNRMAREIHDTLAQGFTGIVLQLEAAEQVINEDVARAQEHLDRARSLARESLNEARRSVWALRPQALEQLPLVDTLRHETEKFIQDSGVKVNLNISGERQVLPPDVESTLLRICQESLNNVRKHARASEAEVNLAFEKEVVKLTIHDNGTGFDTEVPTEGAFGLIGMRERARLLRGTLAVHSEHGQGTRIEVMIPVK